MLLAPLFSGFQQSVSEPQPELLPKNSRYILGAGFSLAAGLPLANELWLEVLRSPYR